MILDTLKAISIYRWLEKLPLVFESIEFSAGVMR